MAVACGARQAPAVVAAGDLTVDVTLTYLERLGLPAGVVYSVELVEAGVDGAPIAAANRATAGEQIPLRVKLPVARSRISAGRAYRLRAKLVFRDSTWFTGELDLAAPLPAQARLLLKRAP